MSTTTRTKRSAVDSACAEAVSEARAEAVAVAGFEVGDHLGYVAEDERAVTHHFACTNPAYVGWHWAVTVVRAARAKTVTVAEVVLLPGDAAVLAPVWVPWEDRLRPGDLGPGDILPIAEDDDRVMPGWAAPPTPPFDPEASREQWWVAAEAGLVRPRVMSPLGRADTIDRWYSGERGPDAPIAQAAPSNCASCGFGLPMAGAIGRLFAVCANEYAPDDGHVVSLDHGCGGHSEITAIPAALAERTDVVLDDESLEVVEADGQAEAVAADVVLDAAVDEAPGEISDLPDVVDSAPEQDAPAEADSDSEADAPAP
ncbi:MAG: DUF3027 domain-containing protein [Sporichthyaceae bacterium]